MSIERSGLRAVGDHPISRRRALKIGGGTAAAVLIGLGTKPDAASAASASSQSPLAEPLRAVDAHAFTGRTTRAVTATTPQLRILPIDRAKFQAEAHFDLRVEATGVDPATAQIAISVSGPHGPEPILRGQPERYSPVAGGLAVTYFDLTYPRAGMYTVMATADSRGQTTSAQVTHEVVVSDGDGRRAKNVIFFLGDGMGSPAITAARILSKGIKEGKYKGLLEMDQMEYRGLVSTSGYDSIATDSANSMSAYMTGHKSSVNAMGVYEGNDPDPSRHPRVENITELLKRSREMAIGIVTTAEIQDATPAAVWAHTRRRSEYVAIMDQALKPAQMPDVLLGGGRASLLPKSVSGSRRQDERDLREEFKNVGFSYAESRTQLHAALNDGAPRRLLGLFQNGNMNVYLDRQHAPNPTVLGPWTDQPNLMEMTDAALRVLEQDKNGFFLMVEGASIDKMEHPLDGPRGTYDTIEFDQAIGVARRWAAGRNDTLIVVTADHNHSMSVVGTHTRAEAGRAGNGVYADAGYPTYADTDHDGFPDDPNPDVQLFFGWASHPDHRDDFRLDAVPTQPALISGGVAVPNPTHDAGAELQTGNLPLNQTNCVHTVEDVSVFASGPGAARFNGLLDNTEVFHAMMAALQLRPKGDHVDPKEHASATAELPLRERELVTG